VQVGTATFTDPLAPLRVLESLNEYLLGEQISARELVGSLCLDRN
jgi:hypothetical protein